MMSLGSNSVSEKDNLNYVSFRTLNMVLIRVRVVRLVQSCLMNSSSGHFSADLSISTALRRGTTNHILVQL
jgi:hypothetical protein